jgi:signal transduction histidine kinase
MIDEIFLDLNNLLFIRISLLILSGVCIGVIIVMFMVHRIAGPLFRVKKVLGIIGDGIIPEKVRFRKKDELKDIADTINEVISKISELQGGNLNTIEKVKVCLKRAEDCMKNNPPQTDKAAKEIESALKTLSDIRTFKKQIYFS